MAVKRLLILSAAMATATGILHGCAPAETKTSDVFLVAYCDAGGPDALSRLKQDGLEQRIARNGSMEIISTEAGSDISTQLFQISHAIQSDADTIIIVPVDYAGVKPGIEEANRAGVPVICFGVEAEGGAYTYIGCRNRNAGILQAEYMIKTLPQNAGILYLSGASGLYHSAERRDGFLETIADERPDLRILDEKSGQDQYQQAMETVAEWCRRYPAPDGFNAIVCASDQMALGAIDALKAAGRLENVLVAGVDATEETLRKVRDGEMAITIRQPVDKLVAQCYETLQRIQKGEDPGNKIIVSLESVTAENVGQYLS